MRTTARNVHLLIRCNSRALGRAQFRERFSVPILHVQYRRLNEHGYGFRHKTRSECDLERKD